MIYDLLDNSTTARATREDIKRGVYVDGVTEESIHNPEDAYKVNTGIGGALSLEDERRYLVQELMCIHISTPL